MRTLALIRKELASYFAGPLVYVVVGAFLLATGYRFYTTLNSYVTFGFGMNILEHFWEDFFVNHIGFYLLIVVPLFTMRWNDVLSNRLGNYEYNPMFGFLIDQAWVR